MFLTLVLAVLVGVSSMALKAGFHIPPFEAFFLEFAGSADWFANICAQAACLIPVAFATVIVADMFKLRYQAVLDLAMVIELVATPLVFGHAPQFVVMACYFCWLFVCCLGAVQAGKQIRQQSSTL